MNRLLRQVLIGTLLIVPAASCGKAPSSGREKVDFLIANGTVLTMDADFHVYNPGFVAVSGDRIAAVGPASGEDRFVASDRIDGRNHLVLPGLINGHQHAPMSLFRGLADDRPLMDWLQNYIFPAEAKNVDPDFVYWGTLLSSAEMIASGTTTYADMYYFEDQVARATAQAGLRGVLGETIIDFPAPDNADPAAGLKYAESFIRKWKGNPLIHPAVAPHAPYTCSRATLLACRDLADRYQVPILIHLSETQDEVRQIQKKTGLRPVEYLQKIGFLSGRVVAAHVIWVNETEIKILKAFKVGVIHNPESNMKLADGVAPIPALLEAGVPVGLGTDGPASNNNLDLLQEMDTMAKLQKLWSGDPTEISARDALKAATLGGARALGLEKSIGSLETGKQADLVLLRLDGPSATPSYDPYSTVVYSLLGNSVDTVMVAGKVLYRGGRFLTLDFGQIREKALEIQKRIEASLKPAAPK